MSKRAVKKSAIGITILAVMTLTAGWLFGWFSENPAVAEVRQMQAKLADPNLKDTDRRAMMDQIRSKMESLSPDVRRGLWEENRQVFEKRMDKHVDDLLAMSKADRNKALMPISTACRKCGQRLKSALKITKGPMPTTSVRGIVAKHCPTTNAWIE